MIKKKPTIESLEALLRNEESTPIQIMPNGEVRAMSKKALKKLEKEKLKPITLKEDLGGEYACAA